MRAFLRWLLGVPLPLDTRKLESRIAYQEARMAEWEVTLTGLTDKLSSQLKRLAQRDRRAPGDDDDDSDEAINRRIRARRAGLPFRRE